MRSGAKNLSESNPCYFDTDIVKNKKTDWFRIGLLLLYIYIYIPIWGRIPTIYYFCYLKKNSSLTRSCCAASASAASVSFLAERPAQCPQGGTLVLGKVPYVCTARQLAGIYSPHTYIYSHYAYIWQIIIYIYIYIYVCIC